MRDVERRLRALEAVRIAEAAPKVRSLSSLSWAEAMAGLPHDEMYHPAVVDWYRNIRGRSDNVLEEDLE